MNIKLSLGGLFFAVAMVWAVNIYCDAWVEVTEIESASYRAAFTDAEE